MTAAIDADGRIQEERNTKRAASQCPMLRVGLQIKSRGEELSHFL